MHFIPKQLVIIGDSGVYGWGDREGGGWCERLRKNFMNSPNTPIIYSLGVRGDGIERVAKRWQQEWECRGELRRKVPEGVLISIGLNDTAKIGRPDGRPQLSAEAFRFGLQQLLEEIKKNTTVMVIGLTAVDESPMPFAKCLWYKNISIMIYEAQIEETCLELDIPFLPIHKAMLNEPEYLTWLEPDGIHLNELGHKWIFNRLINWPSLLKWAELDRMDQTTSISS